VVGFEGDRPNQVVRVKAQHQEYPVIKRELDLKEKKDNTKWSVGDKISLLNGEWVEYDGNPTSAIITEVVTPHGD